MSSRDPGRTHPSLYPTAINVQTRAVMILLNPSKKSNEVAKNNDSMYQSGPFCFINFIAVEIAIVVGHIEGL